MSYFVETLNEVLQEQNLRVCELAKKINIHPRTLSNLNKFNPTIPNALKIVDYFSSSLDYFERKTDVFKCKYKQDYKILFFANLRKEIREQNLTIEAFCKGTGVAKSSFDRWRSGTLPTYGNLLTICQFLDVSIDKLLGREYQI